MEDVRRLCIAVGTTFLLVLVSQCSPMPATPKDSEVPPPITPQGSEERVPNDPAFVSACEAALNRLPMAKVWTIRASLLTRSDAWGTVWRFDYEIPGEELPNMINRMICWRTPTGTLEIIAAVGHDVPPLQMP